MLSIYCDAGEFVSVGDSKVYLRESSPLSAKVHLETDAEFFLLRRGHETSRSHLQRFAGSSSFLLAKGDVIFHAGWAILARKVRHGKVLMHIEAARSVPIVRSDVIKTA